MTDRAETRAALAHFHRDVEYGQAHYEELLNTYPEQWIAIYGERVVGSDPDLPRLVESLRKRGVPPEHTFFDFMTHETDVLIV